MALPVYVINLDRRPDRLEAITADLDRAGLAFERIKAIDGQELQDDLGPEPLLNLVEKACVLSHANALRHLLQSEHPAAVILEDDAEFGEGLEHLIGSIDWWPEDVVLLKLDQPFPRKRLMGPPCGRTPDRRDLRENIRWSSGAVGYIATRAAAGKILVACESDEIMPFDELIYDCRISALARWLRAMQVDPAPVRQRDRMGPYEFSSDLDDSRQTRESLSYRRRRRRRRRSRRRLYLWLLWATGRARSMKVDYRS